MLVPRPLRCSPSAQWECFTSGDGDSYAFDLQGVISISIHV